jgi:hypothetical protein
MHRHCDIIEKNPLRNYAMSVHVHREHQYVIPGLLRSEGRSVKSVVILAAPKFEFGSHRSPGTLLHWYRKVPHSS